MSDMICFHRANDAANEGWKLAFGLVWMLFLLPAGARALAIFKNPTRAAFVHRFRVSGSRSQGNSFGTALAAAIASAPVNFNCSD